jgi:hypothetical protein
MTVLRDLTGQRFGRLVVTARAPNVRPRYTRWLCLCDCGNARTVDRANLCGGRTQSCGCLNAAAKIGRQTKHGDAPFHGPRAPEYRAWRHIKGRCFNPNVKSYPRYGGAGITMCEEWAGDYRAFLRDMGRRPSPKHSVDRIEGTLGYEPGNCRWATATEQSRNRRNVKLSEAAAHTIRAEAMNGTPRRALRERFAVSKQTIARIIDREIWANNHAE